MWPSWRLMSIALTGMCFRRAEELNCAAQDASAGQHKAREASGRPGRDCSGRPLALCYAIGCSMPVTL